MNEIFVRGLRSEPPLKGAALVGAPHEAPISPRVVHHDAIKKQNQNMYLETVHSPTDNATILQNTL
jgi:hypothetical protein